MKSSEAMIFAVMNATLAIGQFRILTVGLDLARNEC